MPRGNKGRNGTRNSTHRTRHNRTQRRRSDNSKSRQTRKNRTRTTPRTTTPFDAVSALRNRERWETMQKLSTNPFGRTAKERYGIDTVNVSGDVMSRLASSLQKKRDRRRRKRKDELTEQEQRLKREIQADFLKEGMNLKPDFWKKEAWEQELRDVMDPKTDVMDPRRESPYRRMDLEPIEEVTITEVDEVPVLSLNKASLFSRRRKAEGNTKRKRERKKKKHATQKRKRKRKRKKR